MKYHTKKEMKIAIEDMEKTQSKRVLKVDLEILITALNRNVPKEKIIHYIENYLL